MRRQHAPRGRAREREREGCAASRAHAKARPAPTRAGPRARPLRRDPCAPAHGRRAVTSEGNGCAAARCIEDAARTCMVAHIRARARLAALGGALAALLLSPPRCGVSGAVRSLAAPRSARLSMQGPGARARSGAACTLYDSERGARRRPARAPQRQPLSTRSIDSFAPYSFLADRACVRAAPRAPCRGRAERRRGAWTADERAACSVARRASGRKARDPGFGAGGDGVTDRS